MEKCFHANPPRPLERNAFAWDEFKGSFWQWSSAGFGDATLNALFIQNKLGDRGITGHAREAQMDRIRVLADEFGEMQRIRGKRKPQESSPPRRMVIGKCC